MYFHPKRREAAGISLDELKTLPNTELVARHDKWLIDVWNSTVKRGDTVYHLGDFCLGNKVYTEYVLSKLNGKKYFIHGNHDKSLFGNERFLEGFWIEREVKFRHEQYPFIKEGETFCIELKHEPMLAWNRRPHGTCHLHGHTHGSIDQYNEDQLELRLDVGLDARISNYGLVDLETVYAHFRSIIAKQGYDSFQEYQEWLMAKQGFRM